MTTPYFFDEFFASGMEESISPFLTKSSRKWGKNLALKRSLLAAILLGAAFTLYFFHPPISHLLLSFCYFLVGVPAILNTIEDFKNWEINIDVLMTLAAFLSVVIGSGLEGALLLVLFEFSGAMEEMVSKKARGSLHQLHKLAPRFASVINEEGISFEKSIHEILPGEKILVKTGAIVPLDGVVVDGSSSLNLVHLTGESLPVGKTVSDEVPAGSHNLESALVIKVTRTSSDSTLSRIIQLITQAQASKPKLQKVLDRFGKPYATTVMGLTLIFALFLPWVLPLGYFGIEGSIYRALAFMIAASPCALIIATPTAYLSAISACARKGILLKGGITLDALSRCRAIAFDKTGTLTTGELVCKKVIPLSSNSSISEDQALAIAASLEREIVHPIAAAIERAAREKNLSLSKVNNFSSHPGYGLEGELFLEEKKVSAYIGTLDFILPKLKEPPSWQIDRDDKKTLSILLVDDIPFLFELEDQVRSHLSEPLRKMQTELNLELILLTGDHKKVADSVAKQLSIDTVYAELKPDEKLKHIADLSSQYDIAMVGDGINDAPALTRASVGIAMGKMGSATAVEASDVILLHDELPLIHWLFKKANKTMRIVKQNISLALAVIFFATTPALLGWIPLWLAVVLHEGGTVLVGINSLRLLRTSQL